MYPRLQGHHLVKSPNQYPVLIWHVWRYEIYIRSQGETLFIEASPITSACGESQSQQQLERNMRGQLMRSKIRKMEFNKLCWVKVGNCLRWRHEMGKRNPHVMWSDIYHTNSSDFSSHVLYLLMLCSGKRDGRRLCAVHVSVMCRGSTAREM